MQNWSSSPVALLFATLSTACPWTEIMAARE